MQQLLDWLVQGAIGPAAVALPIDWAASVWADAARRWFERMRRTDALSLLVMSAAEGVEPLSRAEFRAVRHLLERVETWDVAGHGTPEDLIDLIAGQLPERSAHERSALSRAIAAAVLDFAVHELEPELYNEAQPARLARVAANEASPLDRALVMLAGLTGSMAEALDRLPPGPAGIAEVTAYLNGLVEWLDDDPWPQDDGFGGWPVLVPSQIERKLEISTERTGHVPGQQVRDADELTNQCRRLVILGDPGSGKTWLAKRAARRCARGALARLASGAALDEVELPLFTTCEDLLSTARRATSVSTAAWSALSHIPGVGGVRIITSLQVLFETREGPTVIVLDSLDEGHGAEVLIRELVTESPAWRIIVTSRPSTWNQWRPIPDNDPARIKGTLRPLRYPDDVEPFISQWFASDPAAGTRLIVQLRRRPPLREAATVPLILAFYCVLGGDQELPERRADLYPLVIDCLLTGRWRGRHDHQDFDPEACLRLLRKWAWSATRSDEGSRIKAWSDHFSTEPVLSLADRRALDHVAVAIKRGVPKDEQTTSGSMHRTTRRFVHRTIQEHLVAEYVAALPADQAAEALLSHLWYDPDWEYAAPVGLILHPQRDEVLVHLIRRLTGGDFSGGFAAFDGCREIRRFLARVALESAEADWSPHAAAAIILARHELAFSDDVELVPASRWPASSGLLANALLDRLEAEAHRAQVPDLNAIIRTLTRVGITPEQRDRFRALLGKCLAKAEDVALSYTFFSYWVAVFIVLEPSAEERAKVRELLLDRLAARPYLDLMAVNGVTTLQGLAPTMDERTQLSRQLISLLPTMGHDHAGQIVDALLQLDPDDDVKREVREILLADLPIRILSDVERAWNSVAKLDPTPTDRERLVAMLLNILSGAKVLHRLTEVARPLAWLEATAEEREQAHAALLTAARRAASTKVIFDEIGLAHTVAELGEADDALRVQVRDALVSRIASSRSSYSARRFTEGVLLLQMSAAETQQLLTKVASALSAETDPERVRALAEAGTILCAAESGEAARQEWFRGKALEASLRRCERWLHDTQETPATPQQDVELAELPDDLRRLAVTPEERARAHQALLAMFSRVDGHNPRVLVFVGALTELAATVDERASTRRALTRALVSGTESWAVQVITDSLFQLGVTDSEQVELKAILIRMFAWMPDSSEAESVARQIIRLNPTLDDLHGSADWLCKPTDGLLAAIRRDTPFPAWLAALPEIAVG